jgi:hypothetical protein
MGVNILYRNYHCDDIAKEFCSSEFLLKKCSIPYEAKSGDVLKIIRAIAMSEEVYYSQQATMSDISKCDNIFQVHSNFFSGLPLLTIGLIARNYEYNTPVDIRNLINYMYEYFIITSEGYSDLFYTLNDMVGARGRLLYEV